MVEDKHKAVRALQRWLIGFWKKIKLHKGEEWETAGKTVMLEVSIIFTFKELKAATLKKSFC